jgi:hypothetical protein
VSVAPIWCRCGVTPESQTEWMNRRVAFLCLLMGCGGESEPPVTDVCSPAPAGFVAWRSGELVMVSKKLTGTASGVQLRAEVHNISGPLPSVVDFGSDQIEVRPDLSLCLVSG